MHLLDSILHTGSGGGPCRVERKCRVEKKKCLLSTLSQISMKGYVGLFEYELKLLRHNQLINASCKKKKEKLKKEKKLISSFDLKTSCKFK